MIQKIMATVLFVSIIAFVITNLVVLQRKTDDLIARIKEISVESESAFQDIIDIDMLFKRSEKYIGVTVSHDDLTNIEDCFAEITGYLSVGDVKGAEVAKYRLIRFFQHLRRLVDFNIDTII